MARVLVPRPAPSDYAPVFHDEIALVPEGADLVALLATQLEETCAIAARFGETGAGLRYADGKWTVREVIGHLADCERVLSYRLLRFIRRDATPLAGFDHDAWVPAGDFESRTLASVIAELRAVRGATIALVGSAPLDAFAWRGQVGKGTITAAAILYVIAGHERHHQEVVRERYLPLLGSASGSGGRG